MKPSVKKQTLTSTLCGCCKAVPHDFIPERDLDCYVCKDCAVKLGYAEAVMACVGIVGCTKET